MTEPSRILAAGFQTPSWRPLLDRVARWARRLDSVASIDAGLARLEIDDYDLFLVELATPDEAAATVERALRSAPDTPVVALTYDRDPDLALELGRVGVADLLGPDGGDLEKLQSALSRLENVWRRGRERRVIPADADDAFAGLVGSSPALRRAVDVLRLIAPRRSTVLIEGPSGCGKELAARALHRASPRSAQPFVEVNCAAVPESLFESELFGHVKGAFTGAISSRPGRFEQAHGGTLFLDEVGELPLEMQPKLLRVLQEREVQRVGGRETIAVDVRVIAATNRSLEELVAEGRFREDLFYRLNVVPAPLPSLAARRQDIPALIEHVLARLIEREGLPHKRVSGAAVERLCAYPWPGNVRQLENAIEKAAALSGDREVLLPSDFPLPSPPPLKAEGRAWRDLKISAGGLDFSATVAGFERNLLEQALELTGGNKKRAAELLRMKRTTLNARWKALAG